MDAAASFETEKETGTWSQLESACRKIEAGRRTVTGQGGCWQAQAGKCPSASVSASVDVNMNVNVGMSGIHVGKVENTHQERGTTPDSREDGRAS